MIRHTIFRNHRRCSICNSRLPIRRICGNSKIMQLMKTERLCHECAYWLDMAKTPRPYTEVINGKCYSVNPMVNASHNAMILGGGGKMRYFIRPDRTLVCSNDVWKIGKIPERFRDRFSDTMMEISKKTYNSLSKSQMPLCLSKACFDRYFCFRHKTFWVGPEGDFEDIPKNWKPGSEKCRYFMNKKNIRPLRPLDDN